MIVLRRRTVAVLSFALLCVLALAGCGTDGGEEDGEGAHPFPPRPVSVPADRIPPCSMLSPDQALRLTLTRSKPSVVTVNGLPSPICIWSGTEIDVNVQYVPIPASTALTAPGAAILPVNGFGAVRDTPDLGGLRACQVVVDVADNQSIRVQVSPPHSGPTDIADLCRRADGITSMVMTTVVALTPR